MRIISLPQNDSVILELYLYLNNNHAMLLKQVQKYVIQLDWDGGKFFCSWCDKDEVNDFLARLGKRFREINKLEPSGPYR